MQDSIIDIYGSQIPEGLTQLLSNNTSQYMETAVSMITNLKGYLNFNKFIQVYESFAASKGYELETLSFIVKFSKIIDYKTKDGEVFKGYNYDLIDILNKDNESIINIDDWLKELKGVSFSEKRYDIFNQSMKGNPFVIHDVYYAGDFKERPFYGYKYSPVDRSDMSYLNELHLKRINELMKPIAQPDKVKKFDFKSKKTPK